MYMTADVDMFGGFSVDLLKAKYLLVADPIQTHQGEQNQHIITYPASLALDRDSYFGKHYSVIREYMLENNVRVELLKKVSALDDEVYDIMSAYFEELYPNYLNMFSNRIEAAKPKLLHDRNQKMTIKAADGIMSSEFGIKNGIYQSLGTGYLVYGPYTTILKGNYTFTFNISYEEEQAADTEIGKVEISSGRDTFAEKGISMGQKEIKIENVNIPEDEDSVEYKIYINRAGVKFDSITIAREN